MHGLTKAQRCGALAVYDGYCPVHLKERGYTRCPECGAWRQPPIARGLPGRGGFSMSAPVCDVCASLAGPTQQPLDARAHAGDGDGAAREAGAFPLDARDVRRRTMGPAPCPRCYSSANVRLLAEAAHAEAPRDTWECSACALTFTTD